MNQKPITEWRATLWRDIRSDLESKPGTTLDWKADAAGNMSIDTKGYTDAIKPLMGWVAQDPENRRLAGEVWAVRFSIRNSKFRPTYEELAVAVRKALKIRDIPQENSAAYKPVTAPVPTVLGIPGATVASAYHGVPMPKRSNITLEDVPTHDNEGNLIGEGRRRVLCSMHRMRGGHHPNPDKEPVLDFEEGPKPKMYEEYCRMVKEGEA